MNKKLEEINLSLKDILENKNLKYHFPSEISDGLYLKRNINYLKKIADDSKDLREIVFAMNNSSSTYFMYLLYSYLILEDEKIVEKNLAYSTMYSVLFVQLADELKNDEEEAIRINQNSLSLKFSQSIFLSWYDCSKNLFEIIVNNLDEMQDKSIILNNDVVNANLDFVLKLYSLMASGTYPSKDKEVEFNLLTYQRVFDNCFSKDLTEVDLLVNLLCETHLEFVEENDMYNDISSRLFPYEILVWLKLREENGLANPKKFSHDLMNQNLTNLFNFKNIKKPINMPEGTILLKKLKKKKNYLNIDETFFYEEELNKEEIVEKQTIIKEKIVPKTGKYRATLPKKHDQSEKLSYEPFSYNDFIKDKTFTYEGLEEYDIENIIWVFQE